MIEGPAGLSEQGLSGRGGEMWAEGLGDHLGGFSIRGLESAGIQV